MKRVPLLLSLALLLACGSPSDAPPPSPEPASSRPQAEPKAIFLDHTASSGLDFVHWNGMTGAMTILEIMGAGGALADVDGDGDLDLYLVQGAPFLGTSVDDALVPPRHEVPLTDRLYQNQLVETGEPRFRDVTAASGLAVTAERGYGIGVAAGDYDGDGHTDLYIAAFGRNQLLRNLGDGTFEDVTAEANAADDRWSTAAVFVDVDQDGWLDLWIGNYVVVPEEMPVCTSSTGATDYCGPASFRPEEDRLLRNLGDGTFEDITASAGLAGAEAAPALGIVAADFDLDGWPDLYVANDSAPNFLWHHQGGTPPVFVDDALMSGAALNARGQPEASMGVDAADFDGDGDLDLFMTHLVTETNTLYLNDGHGLFTDATVASGLGAVSTLYTSFGTAAVDVDNDGWQDLVVANGAVNTIEALARAGDPYPLHLPNQLFRNVGGGRFEDATEAAGPAFALSEVSRGAIFGDLDNDGDADVVLANNNGPARLLLNQVGQDRPWLGVRLLTGSPPRDALGARAAILPATPEGSRGEPRLWRRVRVDGSYASASDPRILFGLGGDVGLGEEPAVGGVRVVWADGTVEDFSGIEVGRYTSLVQGTGESVE